MSSILLQYSKIENFSKFFFWKNYILKKWTDWRAKVSQCRKTERGDPLRFFNIHSVAKHEKIEEKNFFFIFGKKNLTMPKKTERGTLWGFSTSILSQNIKKMQGDPLGKKKFRKKNSEKKCLAVPKKIERGDSLVSPGLVCYAEKQVKPFWFSSLDQIVHFGAIIFCRTFVELFWSVRVDRKKKSHYNSRVSLHEAPTKNVNRNLPVEFGNVTIPYAKIRAKNRSLSW